MPSCAIGFRGECGEIQGCRQRQVSCLPVLFVVQRMDRLLGFVSLSRQNRRRIQISSGDCDEKCDNNWIL